MFVDIIVALVVFAIKLDWTLTLVIFVVLSAYSAFWTFCSVPEFVLKLNLVAASILLTRLRIWLRRAMNERDTVCQHIPSSRKHNPNHAPRSRVASTQTVY
jgi:ATP-binding cassette subfamily B (MDR/TAP) protein 6